MKIFKSLLFRLILAIVVGAIVGLFCRERVDLTAWFMQVIVCIHRLLGQFVSFCVPLVILGCVGPAITKLGNNVGKLLSVALIIAYTSTVLVATMSVLAGYVIVPMLNINEVTNSLTLPDAIFKLDIPRVMSVITALVLSIVVGLATVWTNATTTKQLLAEFQKIVFVILERVVIPILPFYIGTTFVTLGFDGTLTNFPVFIVAILVVVVGHFIWLTVLYLVAGIYSGKNPVEVFKHYGPAYITAIGTMSSVATLPVALECAKKSTVIRKDLIGFGIPLFANIHLCGSVLTETFLVMLIYKLLNGMLPPVSIMILFIVLLGIFAVGAPGVPGGTVVASLGIVESIICAGLSPESTATFTGMLIAIFALQDSFGTACNIIGDGALTLLLSGYVEKYGLKEN